MTGRDPATRPVAVIVGAPGAGKSTVGQLVAEALRLDFRDTDADIEATAGKPIPDIFVDDGEERFRALERAAVATALESFDGVLALGGGAVLAAETRPRLRGHPVGYLWRGPLVKQAAPGAARAAVIFAAPLRGYAEQVAGVLRGAGLAPLPVEVPDAEAGKTVEVAARCWDALGGAGFTRTDLVVGVGGGAVTDLAGFVAACWLRGVPVVQVPTSLLGMVDAAVGGKTGVNTAAGKNLVGAFHPPPAVLCELSTLDTLPADDL